MAYNKTNYLSQIKIGNTTYDIVDKELNDKVSAISSSVTEVVDVVLNLAKDMSGYTTTADTQYVSGAVDSIQTQIDDMDLTAVGGDGKVITTISQENGKVSATASEITSTDNTVNVNGLDLAVNIDETTIVKDSNGVLSVSPTATAVSGKEAIVVSATTSGKEVSLKIANDEKVLSQSADGLKATISVVKETENLETNVKEQYKVVGTDGVTALGQTIKIYKDSSLKEVKLNDQKLDFTYIKFDGSEETVSVDISKFLAESEFKNGLEVTSDGEVNVKIDTNSEDFLTVGEEGLKLDGVQDAIDSAITELSGVVDSVVEGLDAEVTSTDGEKVTVKVTEVDGKITAVNVTENDIASASALTAEIAARKAVTGVDADTYTANSSTNYLKEVDSLKAADEALDTALKGVSDKLNGITVKVEGNTLVLNIPEA